MNWSGAINPFFGMTPADKGFGAAHFKRLGIDDGLKVKLEFAMRERPTQFVFESMLFHHRLAEYRLKRRIAVSAQRFCVIKCEIGPLQQVVAVKAVLRRQCYANTGTNIDNVPTDRERLRNQLDDTAREGLSGIALIDVVHLYDSEFVAAQPR